MCSSWATIPQVHNEGTLRVCVCVIQIKFYEDTQNKGAVYWFGFIEVVQILLEDNGNIASLPAVIEGGLVKRLLLYQ